jgi:zinc protease
MRNLHVLLALSLAACAPPPPKFEVKLPELHAKVDNGMRIIVLPDTTTDLVEVDVRYEVGSNEDYQGKAGLAHFVEHLMFQLRPAGADKPPIFDVVRQFALFFNAYTTWDQTHYMTLVKKDALETVFAIEASRLLMGCKGIDQGQFEREREVVRNEMRQRLGSPDGQLEYKLLEAIYPAGHPYRREVGGDDQQISSIQLEDACKFIESFYVPERATVIVAGNVTEAEVKALSAKWFAPIPKKSGAPRNVVSDVKLEKKRVEIEFAVEEPQLFVAWRMPPWFSQDGRSSQFVANQMINSVSNFADDYEFATEVNVQGLGGPLAPVVVLQLTLKDTGKVNEALDFVWKAAKSAGRGWEDDRDFEKSKRQMLGSLVQSFESLTARTNTYGDYEQFQEDKKYFRGEMDEIQSLRAARIKELASLLDPGKAFVFVVKPKADGEGKYKRAKVKFNQGKTEEEHAWGADPAEAKKALPMPSVASMVSKAHRFQLGNGMRVVLLPSASQLPLFRVQLIFDVGSAHEPPAKAGLAGLSAQELFPDIGEEGTFIDELDSVARMYQAGLGGRGYADTDHTTFDIGGINVYTEQAFKGLEAMIRAGDYSQEAIERQAKRFRTVMKRKSAQDRVAFDRVMRSALFGPEHPYVLTGARTLETIGNLGRDAAVGFKRDHYSAKNATMIVTGNFDVALVEKQIRSSFGNWPGGREDKPVSAAPHARSAPSYLGVEAGEETPSILAAIAFPSPAGIDGQHAARMVLGEMLNIRMSAVREQLGSSYGVYGGKRTRVGPGSYEMGGALDGERAGESLAAMRAGLDRLRKGEKFDEDFVKARRVVLHELVTTATESSAMGDQLAQIARYGLPNDFYDKLVKQVAALSPAQVKALIETELRPELEVVVLLGTKPLLEKAFAGAGLKGATFVKAGK